VPNVATRGSAFYISDGKESPEIRRIAVNSREIREPAIRGSDNDNGQVLLASFARAGRRIMAGEGKGGRGEIGGEHGGRNSCRFLFGELYEVPIYLIDSRPLALSPCATSSFLSPILPPFPAPFVAPRLFRSVPPS